MDLENKILAANGEREGEGQISNMELAATNCYS